MEPILNKRGARVVVVGAGISGIAAAWTLDRAGFDVVLLEAGSWIGGHTCTREIRGGGVDGQDVAVDVGFIVHNNKTYPEFTSFLRDLRVPVRDTEMSFSVSCRGCGLEYAGRNPLGQLPGILRPRVIGLAGEILRFQRLGRAMVSSGEMSGDSSVTLESFVRDNGFSEHFAAHYLVPLTAAIWSTAPAGVLDFPMSYALQFFSNHGLLGVKGLQWKTIVGGSDTYVKKFLDVFGGVALRDSQVASVSPSVGAGPQVTLVTGEVFECDAVVVAAHADTALEVLAEPSELHQSILGSIEYTTSEVVLHADEQILPRRQAARASWNYHLPSCSMTCQRPTMSYYMNRLQGIRSDRHWTVTLNRGADIQPDTVELVHSFSHPRFTHDTLRAQRKVPEMQGVGNIWFAGAWTRHGFHEDGFVSGAAAGNMVIEKLVSARQVTGQMLERVV